MLQHYLRVPFTFASPFLCRITPINIPKMQKLNCHHCSKTVRSDVTTAALTCAATARSERQFHAQGPDLTVG